MKHFINIDDGEAMDRFVTELKKFPYVFESEEVNSAMVKFILAYVKYRATTSQYYNTSSLSIADMLDKLCEKLGPVFTQFFLEGYKDITKFISDTRVTSLVNLILTFHGPENPLSEDLVAVLFQYFSGEFQHKVSNLHLLRFFKENDENLSRLFGLIKQNEANYTPDALLYIAGKWKQSQSEKVQIPHGNLFSDDVEFLITCALQRIAKEHGQDSIKVSTYDGSFLPRDSPNSDIQWVFKTMQENPATAVAKSDQFHRVLALIDEAFSNDIPTILSLCTVLSKNKVLHQKCKSKFGKNVIQLIDEAAFKKLESIQAKQYWSLSFVQDLVKAQEYYKMCASGGLDSFKQLLIKIQKQEKRMRRLIANQKELLYPRNEVYRGYIVFAFSVIIFVCLSVCLFVCL